MVLIGFGVYFYVGVSVFGGKRELGQVVGEETYYFLRNYISKLLPKICEIKYPYYSLRSKIAH